jgi:hypothetical protein
VDELRLPGSSSFEDHIGDTRQVLDHPAEAIGDESTGLVVGVDLGSWGSAQGEVIFLRSGNLISVIIYLIVDDEVDQAAVEQVARTAAEELARTPEELLPADD